MLILKTIYTDRGGYLMCSVRVTNVEYLQQNIFVYRDPSDCHNFCNSSFNVNNEQKLEIAKV